MNAAEHVVAGNVFDKYGSRNPIVRALMNGFVRNLLELAESTGAREIHEVGCGEGYLAAILASRGFRVRGSDLSPDIIAEARRRTEARGLTISFRAASVYDLSAPSDAAALVVCAEVLEHLENPERALQVLRTLAQPWVLLSVPREPVWRIANLARLRYARHLGNTPGHVQHWSRAAFVALVSAHFEVVRVASPFPWTIVLARSSAYRRNGGK